MVPRENKNNAYAKFGGTNKKYYGIIPSGLYQVFHGFNFVRRASARTRLKTRKDCGLHPILLITLMIQDIENIKQLNFELF